MIKPFVLPALLILLVGCTNIQNDATRTRTEGAVAGCAAGAVLGSLLGDNRKSVAAGCAAGGVAGYAVGSHVANKKRQYANEEAYLRDVLLQAQNQNRAISELNRQLLADIDRLHQQEKTLYRNYQTERARKLAATQMQEDARQRLQQVRQAIARTDQELQVQRQVLAQEKSGAPSFYLSSAPGLINQLEDGRQNLAVAENRLQTLQNNLRF